MTKVLISPEIKIIQKTIFNKKNKPRKNKSNPSKAQINLFSPHNCNKYPATKNTTSIQIVKAKKSLH